jgi:hypothetical protein
MTLRLGPLIMDAVDVEALSQFWTAALGASARRALLSFRPERRPKAVKNRVHLDVYAADIDPLLALGATVLAEYPPQRVTMADIEGNEFCVFLDSSHAQIEAFAVCTDSDRPEDLAAWWAARVGAGVRNGPDGTPRWLYGSAGWEHLIWKFVRVADERVVPNRVQWSVLGDRAEEAVDPQGNDYAVTPPAG